MDKPKTVKCRREGCKAQLPAEGWATVCEPCWNKTAGAWRIVCAHDRGGCHCRCGGLAVHTGEFKQNGIGRCQECIDRDRYSREQAKEETHVSTGTRRRRFTG